MKALIAVVSVSLVLVLGVITMLPSSAFAKDTSGHGSPKPTVVFVHGAFAESSSFNPVTSRLLAKGYSVIAVANPLRSVKGDADYVGSVLDTIKGPVILVGHSYGGTVISAAAVGRSNVKALVFVSGLAPEKGETAAQLVGKFPGSTLGPTLAPPTPLPGGGTDLYILQDKYHAQFAADVDASESKLMATTQRPIVAAAFDEPFPVTPAWKTLPSWFLSGALDKNIPAAAHAFMAKRANAKKHVEVPGASHVVMIMHPDVLVKLIDEATAETVK